MMHAPPRANGNNPPRQAERGFSLVEVLVALGILGFLMSGVLGSSGGTAMQAIEVLNVTTATQLVESVVLDLEEEYRLDGFPTNQLEGRKCELPRGFDSFDCEYDLLALEIGSDNIGALGQDANENVNQSPLMTAFCSGGPNGDMPVDPAMALANLAATGQDVPTALAAFQALLDPGFTQICGINLERMCTNTAMISSFIPTIIEQAAKATRKLIVRLRWGEEGDPERELTIETFITAVPEAEEVTP
jgi:prepilin-type N-terminal cleavage/methylation domain-containing protein